MIDHHNVYLFGRIGDVEDLVSQPIDADDFFVVEHDFFPEHAAHALNDVVFDGVMQSVGIDDLPAIVRHGEFARPDPAALAIDIDLGNDRNARTVARGIADATAGDLVTGLVLAQRRPRLPAGLGGRRLDD